MLDFCSSANGVGVQELRTAAHTSDTPASFKGDVGQQAGRPPDPQASPK